MKYLFLLLSFISFSSSSQNKDIKGLFFDIPLNQSRDSIYNYITNSKQFLKEDSCCKIIRDGKKIKNYTGSLVNLNSELSKKKIDSVRIQLTGGDKWIIEKNGTKYFKYLLVFWSYFYTSDFISAEKHYIDLKNQITNILKEKSFDYEFNRKEGNDYNTNGQIGYIDNWLIKNDQIDQFELKFEILQENKKYLIRIGYFRNE